MRNHELIVHVVLVIFCVFFVLLVVRATKRLPWLFFFPLVVRVYLVIKPFLETNADCPVIRALWFLEFYLNFNRNENGLVAKATYS